MADAPVIVLTRPQMGENIGAAARAMKNFGCRELRIVAPRDGWPNPKAEAMAAHAEDIVQAATVHDTLAEAVADCTLVLATTARPRVLQQEVLAPEEAAARIHAQVGRSALVFGPENAGLPNEDIALAHALISIPVDPACPSLNLAQAVVICCYRWFDMAEREAPIAAPEMEPASHASVEAFNQRLLAELESTRFFQIEEKKERVMLQLRSMMARQHWTRQEIQLLHGVLGALGEVKNGQGQG